MSHKENDKLVDAIKDIGYALKPDFQFHPDSTPEPKPSGTNFFADVAPEDFGPAHDFETIDHFTHIVFFPVSKAAIKWANTKLPEHLDRWGSHGYKIPVKEIKAIVAAAKRDGLMSEQDWHDACCELDDIALQWEES